MVVINIGLAKCKIIDSYNKLFKKINIGYPAEGYEETMEAIQSVNFVEQYTVTQEESVAIINNILIKL